LIAIAISAAGCSARSVSIHRPGDAGVDRAITAKWEADLRRLARDGDWIVSRAYYLTSDLIVLGTAGEALSHGSIYDATRGTVIESVGSGVRELPLAAFLERNHVAILVRPFELTAAESRAAVARARSRVGAAFDVTGMLGVDDPDRFYCTELVFWASQIPERTGARERVITPADLLKYGEVVYWSGERSDPAVAAAARAAVTAIAIAPPRAEPRGEM
jgi:hypothetical protein